MNLRKAAANAAAFFVFEILGIENMPNLAVFFVGDPENRGIKTGQIWEFPPIIDDLLCCEKISRFVRKKFRGSNCEFP
ncbi:MAG: hypothetical protein CMH54_01055 [Myxococcales bacterium]|nr:hypothetical protein [Myxococcales bacterium]